MIVTDLLSSPQPTCPRLAHTPGDSIFPPQQSQNQTQATSPSTPEANELTQTSQSQVCAAAYPALPIPFHKNHDIGFCPSSPLTPLPPHQPNCFPVGPFGDVRPLPWGAQRKKLSFQWQSSPALLSPPHLNKNKSQSAFQNRTPSDFPGGPVVKTLSFQG